LTHGVRTGCHCQLLSIFQRAAFLPDFGSICLIPQISKNVKDLSELILGPRDGADLRFLGAHTDASRSCKITNKGQCVAWCACSRSLPDFAGAKLRCLATQATRCEALASWSRGRRHLVNRFTLTLQQCQRCADRCACTTA